MTMDRNSVAHALVRFYLAHGSVLPLLDVLTLREINSTSELERDRESVCVCVCVISSCFSLLYQPSQPLSSEGTHLPPNL